MRTLALAAIVAAGIAARVFALDRVPGINADEAWLGVNVHEFSSGGTPFWGTPVGNLLNPFHTLPLLAVSLAMDPAFVLLRIPAVLWGCLAIVLAYPLLSSSIGRWSAVYAAALLAFSASAVSQSRLGWDSSETPLASLVAIALALSDKPLLGALAIVAALVVHPTNVFLVPIVAAAWAPHGVDRYSRMDRRTKRRVRVASGVAALMLLAAAMALLDDIAHRGRLPSIEILWDRMSSPAAWMDTGVNIARLFSGITAAVSIAGPVSRALAVLVDVIAFAAFAVPLVAVGWAGLNHPDAQSPRVGGPGKTGPHRFSQPYRTLWFAAGLACSIAAYHLIAGPAMLQPGFERYATFLIVPLAVACALLTDALSRRSKYVALAVAVITCATFIVVLVRGYFVPIVVTGGASHETYRTGAVEPKAAAFEFIRQDSGGARVVAVFAENWWLYWPLRYLATNHRGRIHVGILENDLRLPLRPAGVSPPVYQQTPDRVYVVVFDGGAIWSRLKDRAQRLYTAVDPRMRPIVHVLGISPADVQPLLGVQPWDPRAAVP